MIEIEFRPTRCSEYPCNIWQLSAWVECGTKREIVGVKEPSRTMSQAVNPAALARVTLRRDGDLKVGYQMLPLLSLEYGGTLGRNGRVSPRSRSLLMVTDQCCGADGSSIGRPPPGSRSAWR